MVKAEGRAVSNSKKGNKLDVEKGEEGYPGRGGVWPNKNRLTYSVILVI
jgi:hypothetical protein